MPVWIQAIVFVLFVSYAIHYFITKVWFFDIHCPCCNHLNKIRWTQRDGIKDNSRVYYFICSSCGEKVPIRDKSLFQGQLPMFVVTKKSEIIEGGHGDRRLPVIVGDEQGK